MPDEPLIHRVSVGDAAQVYGDHTKHFFGGLITLDTCSNEYSVLES